MNLVCAAPDCPNPVPRRPGQTGRPPIYCSPACRPSRRPGLTIHLNHDPDTPQDRTGRDWTVQLRRGPHTLTIATGLGRFSAAAFAADLRTLLGAPITQD